MSKKPEKWDLEVDFIAVGSGCGSITSSIVAHDLGKKVVVLEKAPNLGGVSSYSAGEVFLPNNHKMREAGIPDSSEEGRKYLDFLSAGYNDPKMLGCMLEAAPLALEYLEKEAGVKWRYIKNFPDYYYPDGPGTVLQGRYLEVEMFPGPELGEWQEKTYRTQSFPPGISHVELFGWGGLCGVLSWDFETMAKNTEADLRGFGAGMMAYMVKAAMVDRGIPAYLETGVCELIEEDGAVIGVRAEHEGMDFFVRAQDGVVLGISGYDHNLELARYYEDLPEWESTTMPTVEGDNILLGGEVGAAFARVPANNLSVFMGGNIPGELHPDGKPMYRALNEGGCPHAIWVNRAGNRFCDESFYKDYLARIRKWVGFSNSQPNFPPFMIFDQQFAEKYPLGAYMPGDNIPEEFAASGETPRALAEKLGIDGDKLEATIERYNKFCEKGVDEDFSKGTCVWANMMFGDPSYKNPNMGPLTKPPYRGLRLTPTNSGVNACGLKINQNGQVMHVRGKPIKGLYAVGNSTANVDTGAGYQSGIANMRGIAWGWIAARHAAKGS
ncbi:MAG: FAD-binding protein [Deltaproteobacteria bacterium]|nr:FAD-binding protein [Deltaproteobacteria bacterium]